LVTATTFELLEELMRNVTPLGWFVLGIVAAVAIWALVWVSANVWWTPDGICLGSAAECLVGSL
jgi:hypothetical protein